MGEKRTHWSLAVLALLLGTCAAPEPELPLPPPPVGVVRALGSSVEGRELRLVRLGSGPRTALFLAGIHGDEPAGPRLLRVLREWLEAHPDELEGWSLLLLPATNPDGLAAGRRENGRGVDLNRNFPAANFRPGDRSGPRPVSEPESRILRDLVVEHRPELVVSVHEPLSVVDWDGPGEAIARRMARACGQRAKRLGARPGSMGSWVGDDLGVPIVTLELPRTARGQSDEALWEQFGPALRAALAHPPAPME